jgi:hypothetical protein
VLRDDHVCCCVFSESRLEGGKHLKTVLERGGLLQDVCACVLTAGRNPGFGGV